MAPGHPPSVNMTTSHKLSAIVFGLSSLPLASNNFGKNTLNIV
jgi:hypothetical protein